VLEIGAQDRSLPGEAATFGAGAAAPVDAARFRSAMGKFATGVCVVGYVLDGAPAGLTANAFVSVSLDPPLVLVSVRNQSRFLAAVSIGDRYAVNVLAHHQDQVSDHFGGRSKGNEACAFRDRHGAPLIEDCLASIVARVVDLHPAGDHTLVIGHVEHLEERIAPPLIYFAGRYERIGAGLA
jgi:flavin reductase (DIM6/NTAB) family NADH-FMN oxidoreductase RutF